MSRCPVCQSALEGAECPSCPSRLRRPREEWDAFFLGMAAHVATASKDPDRRVGAVVVSADRRQLSMGYNGLPSDVPDDPAVLGDRDLKLHLMVHAEENALRQAPFELAGSTLYTTRFPCLQCARRIVGEAVARVVAPPPDLSHPRWGGSWRAGRALLLDAGVAVTACEVRDESSANRPLEREERRR